MTFEEVNKIFTDWQSYIEIADKMGKIFTVVPESFLPYPVETLTEALNLATKNFLASGDKKTANNIQETMYAHLSGYYDFSKDADGRKISDEEALIKMKRDLDFMLSDKGVTEAKIGLLERTRSSWAELK